MDGFLFLFFRSITTMEIVLIVQRSSVPKHRSTRFASTSCLSSSVLPSSFIVFYLSSDTRRRPRVESTRVFHFLCVSLCRWACFSGAVLFLHILLLLLVKLLYFTAEYVFFVSHGCAYCGVPLAYFAFVLVCVQCYCLICFVFLSPDQGSDQWARWEDCRAEQTERRGL